MFVAIFIRQNAGTQTKGAVAREERNGDDHDPDAGKADPSDLSTTPQMRGPRSVFRRNCCEEKVRGEASGG